MTLLKADNRNTYTFKNETFHEKDFVDNGKITPLGVKYLLEFKRFSLFSKKSSAIFFIICLPVIIPMAILRLLTLFAVFEIGILLKKHLSISLDNYPRIISFIYFICLGIYIKSKDNEQVAFPSNGDLKSGDRCNIIVSNHSARLDAMMLSNLHQSDSTYLAAAKASFFGKLIINSGICSRSMEEGLALDTKEGRDEWRRRLNSGYKRSMLFFPEGRVVHPPDTIMTFQTHLFHGLKANIICKKSTYKSYFFEHTQIELPFFKAPFSWLKNKTLWDSIIETIPFFVAFVTIFKTEVIGTLQLNGTETPEEIDDSLYSIYLNKGYRLVSLDQNLVKKLMTSLYL